MCVCVIRDKNNTLRRKKVCKKQDRKPFLLQIGIVPGGHLVVVLRWRWHHIQMVERQLAGVHLANVHVHRVRRRWLTGWGPTGTRIVARIRIVASGTGVTAATDLQTLHRVYRQCVISYG